MPGRSTDPVIRGRDEDARRVLELVHESRRSMQEMHENWLYDIQFYRGFQWVYQNNNVGRILPIPVTPWRPRITDNQTRPLITQMLALLIEKDPTWEAVGTTQDEEDLLAAEGYEGLLRQNWDRLGQPVRLQTSLLDMLITGNGFWRIAWNPMGGRPLNAPNRSGESLLVGRGDPPPEDKEKPSAEEEFYVPGQDALATEPVASVEYEGDVEVMVVSPFNIDVPVSATSLEHAHWVAHHAFVHRDVLVDRIGSKAKGLQAGGGMGEFDNYERQLRFDSGLSEQALQDVGELIRVTEFWEAPSKKHAEGRVITVAGGETLVVKKNPYGGRYPFVHFGCNQAPGRFWYDGMVRELEPLQKAHNSSLSRYAMIMMLSANPKVIADKDSGIKDTAINDEPGEIIFKKRGSSVEFVNPPVPASIHPAVISLVMNSMQSITGVNDTLAGQNPPNVRAALSIRFLQESGLRRFVPIARRVEETLRQAGRLVLYLHKRFWSDERLEQVLGSGASAEVYYMRRADIDRIHDVTIRAGSLVPKSPAAQQDLVVNLLQYAPFLFQGQGKMNQEDVLRMLDLPNATGKTGIRVAQRKRAYSEHKSALLGEPISVVPWDDDDLHMEIHGCRLSDEAWSRKNQDAAGALAEHYAAHQINKMQKLSGMMLAPPSLTPTAPEPSPSNGASRPQAGPPAGKGAMPGPTVPPGMPMSGGGGMA